MKTLSFVSRTDACKPVAPREKNDRTLLSKLGLPAAEGLVLLGTLLAPSALRADPPARVATARNTPAAVARASGSAAVQRTTAPNCQVDITRHNLSRPETMTAEAMRCLIDDTRGYLSSVRLRDSDILYRTRTYPRFLVGIKNEDGANILHVTEINDRDVHSSHTVRVQELRLPPPLATVPISGLSLAFQFVGDDPQLGSRVHIAVVSNSRGTLDPSYVVTTFYEKVGIMSGTFGRLPCEVDIDQHNLSRPETMTFGAMVCLVSASGAYRAPMRAEANAGGYRYTATQPNFDVIIVGFENVNIGNMLVLKNAGTDDAPIRFQLSGPLADTPISNVHVAFQFAGVDPQHPQDGSGVHVAVVSGSSYAVTTFYPAVNRAMPASDIVGVQSLAALVMP